MNRTLASLGAALAALWLQGCRDARVTGGGPAAGALAVAPPVASVPAGGTQAFTAAVAGAVVTWSVREGAVGGTVTAGGLYTAPATPGTFHVEAASGGRTGSATVLVLAPPAGVPPNPVISRGVPAFASSGTATSAASGGYQTPWLSGGENPAWLAYDLSGVEPARRGLVLVFWLDDELRDYDPRLNGASNPGPAAYTIDAHAAPGGGAPPAATDAGWVTLVSVTGNIFSSRQHLVDLAGGAGGPFPWLRLRITAFSSGTRASLFLDVHDASQGAHDDYLLLGDSINEGWATHYPYTAEAAGTGLRPGSPSDLMAALRPGRFPLLQAGGTVGAYSTWAKPASGAAGRFDEWLAMFPGRFVSIGYGSNEAYASWSGSRLDDFQASYQHMIDAVLAAGKTAIVPLTIPYSVSTPIRTFGPAINDRLAVIHGLYAGNPRVIPGPDQWTWLSQHPGYLTADPHLSAQGYLALRHLWVDTLSANVYGVTLP
jgi:hypothetical protein